eukprot:g65701.t1
MPVFGVLLSAELEGVKEIKVTSTSFNFSVKCAGCGEKNKNVWLDSEKECEVKGSKGKANLAVKCKGCGRTNSAVCVADKKIKSAYTSDDSGKEVLLGAFDFRGLEPTKWVLGDGFSVEGAGGAKFSDVDLSEDFYEYDDKADTAVEITKISTSIQKL